ncbi:prolyl 3-hydroxylase OGFOD1 [Thrips palmi]|uniref:uS12 prolyl 3-hydroxylase n=1 Tax=Thrips palmi TaxID=161013 RepID=A0A6P9A3F7_THRPL|nr:prolyl 3-hydroxylase OGFOD1 [Thrips palmi]
MARTKQTRRKRKPLCPPANVPPVKRNGAPKKTQKLLKTASPNCTSTHSWAVKDMEVMEVDKLIFPLEPYMSQQHKKIREIWMNGEKYDDNVFNVDSAPFKHCVVKKMLRYNSHLDDVCKELLKLPYNLMLNDLYSCQQSCVAEANNSHPAINAIVKLIKGPLRAFVQRVTGKKFSDKMTITASQYKYTDRLLCHDDNLHDRSVAFIFYLCKDWHEKDGGSLDLFDCDSENQPRDVVKSIFPAYGSFAFFEVTHNSYHQVSEIINPKSVRLSINGWYHGEALPEQVVWHAPLPKMLTPINPRDVSLDKFVNSTWLDPKTHAQVKPSFERELSISLPNFLKPEVFEEVSNALTNLKIKWEACGPANHRRYHVAKPSSLPVVVSQFLKLLQSKLWFWFLSECTVDIDPDSRSTPKCWFEVQRWQAGDYTVLVDDDPLNNMTGIDVHLYFGVEHQKHGGEVYYLGPDRDDEGNLEEAFHLEPENNTATMVAHIEGMAVLTKYLDHRNKPFFKICARYSQSLD